jgi:D-sedoheptulose 7-phosphate isomerase
MKILKFKRIKKEPLQNLVKEQLEEAYTLLHSFISNPENINIIHTAASKIAESLKGGSKIISCGNGGSHCDAMHFAEELSGKFRENRRSLPAIAISDPSYITCTSNDFGFDHVFSRFVEGFGNKGDILLAISTSGNSLNIIKAAEAAKDKGMSVVALTGKDGGKLATLADVEIRVPHFGYADRIQEIHIKIIHIIILLIEEILEKDAG